MLLFDIVIVFLSLCSTEKACTLAVVFANRHHAKVTVNVENINGESSKRFVVEITRDNFDDVVDSEEKKIKSLGVDPVRQVLNFVLEGKKKKFGQLFNDFSNSWQFYCLKNLEESVGHDNVKHVHHKTNKKENCVH